MICPFPTSKIEVFFIEEDKFHECSRERQKKGRRREERRGERRREGQRENFSIFIMVQF